MPLEAEGWNYPSLLGDKQKQQQTRRKPSLYSPNFPSLVLPPAEGSRQRNPWNTAPSPWYQRTTFRRIRGIEWGSQDFSISLLFSYGNWSVGIFFLFWLSLVIFDICYVSTAYFLSKLFLSSFKIYFHRLCCTKYHVLVSLFALISCHFSCKYVLSSLFSYLFNELFWNHQIFIFSSFT